MSQIFWDTELCTILAESTNSQAICWFPLLVTGSFQLNQHAHVKIFLEKLVVVIMEMDTFCCLIWKRDFSASYTCFVVEVQSLVLARRRRKIFERTLDFLHSRRRKRFFFWGRGQNGAIYTHFLHSLPQTKKTLFFFGSKWCHIYYIHIFYTARRRRKNSGFWGVKMVPYIHILNFFWVKMLPYIYTFLEFNFPRKKKKKK